MVHIAQVYQGDGVLLNVDAAVRRGRTMRCDLCLGKGNDEMHVERSHWRTSQCNDPLMEGAAP